MLPSHTALSHCSCGLFRRIAIASFDDLDLLRHAVPTVTTLRLPRQEIGRRSAELLVNRLHGAPAERIKIDVGFEIVQREST